MTGILEQETTVVYDHSEKVYRIFSTYAPHIRKFTADKRAKLIDSGEEWATFEVLADDFDIKKAFRNKRKLTDEQREELAERFRRVREAKDAG